jgi:hypothetical protein
MMHGKNVQSQFILDRIDQGTVGVELGVWKGDSSEKFLTKTSHLHLVDAWDVTPYVYSKEHGTFEDYILRYEEIVGSKKIADFKKFYENIYQQVSKRFKDKPVTIHRMNTQDFFKVFNKVADWVYIDAAHDHNGCYHDLINSLAIIKKGGRIFGDDYQSKPGVKSAVDQFVKETGLKFDNFYKSQYEIVIH